MTLVGLIAESRSNLRMASRAIGRNAAYLRQFIHRGMPRVLAEHDREALAEHLGCSPDELKHDRSPQGEVRPRPPLAVPRGYSAVPEINIRAAAGPGAWNEEVERTKATWILADPLIRHEFQARPEDLRSARWAAPNAAATLLPVTEQISRYISPLVRSSSRPPSSSSEPALRGSTLPKAKRNVRTPCSTLPLSEPGAGPMIGRWFDVNTPHVSGLGSSGS